MNCERIVANTPNLYGLNRSFPLNIINKNTHCKVILPDRAVRLFGLTRALFAILVPETLN